MNKDEAVQELATAGRLSIAHAEDLYDSIIPKPVVKQYVADWYEENKDEFYLNLHSLAWDLVQNLNHYCSHKNQYMKDVTNNFLETIEPANNDFKSWYYNTGNAFQTLVNMHQFGYEVEKEVRYTVRIKTVLGQYLGRYYLNNEKLTPQFARTQFTGNEERPTFTRKELEEADFGWVFSCEGVEVKEVE